VSYDIEIDNIKVELDDKTRDNTRAIFDSLSKIQEILIDIDKRLKAGAL